MKKFWCLSRGHDWKLVVRVIHEWMDPEKRSTREVHRCERCGEIGYGVPA